jgi:methionyl-tRNA synthetase
MVRSLNQYIENVKPWEIAKQVGKDSEAETHLTEVLNNTVGSITQIADLLVPFLPDTAARIHQTFKTGAIIAAEGALFPKIYKYTTDPNAPKV